MSESKSRADNEDLVKRHQEMILAARKQVEQRGGTRVPACAPTDGVEAQSQQTQVVIRKSDQSPPEPSDSPTDTSPAGRLREHLPRIEGYSIKGVLGHGGMGAIVYRAVQLRLDRTVALKVLPAIVGTANPMAVARFRREATSAARLHHTNIVPIYDFGESRDACYYAMELIDGRPLDDVIHKLAANRAHVAVPSKIGQIIQQIMANDAPSEGVTQGGSGVTSAPRHGSSSAASRGYAYYNFVARWMADAADALQYAHERDIIHRDIKPSNLLLATDGRILVADFGLAKTGDQHTFTATGALLGTVRYLSPEQAMAKRVRVDHRTDIYSLGATMYELLTFRPAFTGDDEKEILGSIIARDPTPPRKIIPQIPPELETICLKTLEKLPDARYLTARALAEDLRRYLADLPIVAKRPGIVRRTIKLARRHRWATVAGAAGVLSIAATGYSIVQREQKRREQVLGLLKDGKALGFERHWQGAESAIRDAMALDPASALPLQTMCWLKTLQAHVDHRPTIEGLKDAEEWCRRALEVEPDDIETLNTFGVALKKLGEFPRAVEVYKKVRALGPKYPSPATNLGIVYALIDELDKAEAELRAGAELAEAEAKLDSGKRTNAGKAFRNWACFELSQGKPGAIEHLEKAVSFDSDSISRLLLARALLTLEGHFDFGKAFEEAITANTSLGLHPGAKRIAALASLQRNLFDDAMRYAQTAIDIGDQPVAIAHLICSVAAARNKNVEEARAHLSNALEHWPADLEQKGVQYIAPETGGLWFESIKELRQLREEAERLIGPVRDDS